VRFTFYERLGALATNGGCIIQNQLLCILVLQNKYSDVLTMPDSNMRY
jgi:hypothetical protein